ncbi:MAG: SusC/RagA family TonB-linked outer membrane protein, partial [Prevotellaceae bacterium]|nr:SusC/RagA family TonB-linked outer membrane protein [Prevotellaceae bacterium]
MKKTTIMLIALLLFGIGWASAQTRTVTGTVISAEDGQPVIGATVMVAGTSIGTATDVDGQFTITGVPSSATQLQVSFVGMIAQTVAIQRGPISISLQPDAALLEEVIVVAYGTAKKHSFTGSAAVISTKKLESRPITSIAKGLEGQTTGLQSTSGSGQPGSSPSIVIRGFGSINASTAPLYVVDGIPFDGQLNAINPADVESMTILKDASAGALYGARGANGVVMITTKKGTEGKPRVSFRATAGWASRAVSRYDMVDQRDFVQLTYESMRNSYVFTNGYSWEAGSALARANLAGSLGGEQYNPFKNYTWETLINPETGMVQADAVSAYDDEWMDAIEEKNALRHEYQFSINGGTNNTKYMMSLGYLNEDGILTTTGFQRYNARVNLDTQVTSWFKASLNTALSSSTSNFSNYSGSSTSNVWYTAQFMAPIYPTYLRDDKGAIVYNESGRPELDYGETGRPTADDFNPLGGLIDDKAEDTNENASVRAGMTFGTDSESAGWAQGLKLAINFGVDYRNRNNFSYMNMYHGNQAAAGGLLMKYNMRTQSYTFNQLITWQRDFDLHHFDVLAGHEFYAYNYKYLSAGKTNLIDGVLELGPATTLYNANSYTDNYRIESILSRINYDYADRYYLSLSARTDGSSRFYKDNRWGMFWSVGGNWRVSEEAFMQDVDWVNSLSVKASYGEQGNDALLSGGAQNYYTWQALYSLGWNNENNIGAVVGSLENKDISWEKNGNFNFGIEAGLLNDRIGLSAEYYIRKTSDMLLNYPMAASTGFSGYSANVGD